MEGRQAILLQISGNFNSSLVLEWFETVFKQKSSVKICAQD